MLIHNHMQMCIFVSILYIFFNLYSTNFYASNGAIITYMYLEDSECFKSGSASLARFQPELMHSDRIPDPCVSCLADVND